MTSNYQLNRDDYDIFFDDDPPTVRAARNSNPAVLSTILTDGLRISGYAVNVTAVQLRTLNCQFSPNAYVDSTYGIYTSPLLTAIEAGCPQNVTMLLNAGADPNGIKLSSLSDYSVRFIRGRDPEYSDRSYCFCPPRSEILASIPVSQTAPLTPAEVIARRRPGCFARFWSEPDFPPLRFRSGPARTALETAARVGDVAVFDQLREAGADTSWWLNLTILKELPEEGESTHSALSTSSPIHEAILAEKADMLKHLLTVGFSPNVLPLAAPTRCLPPHAAAIALCDTPNLSAYDILVSQPGIDLSLRTPIFSVHVLHFAAALLDVGLLQHIAQHPTTPLSTAGTTALGHNLLHVACLPRTDVQVNVFSERIYRSVHDVRTLDSRSWRRWNLIRRNPAKRGIFRSVKDTLPFPPVPSSEEEERERDERTRQEEMVMWLLNSGTQDLAVQDVHGNTALHYLAASMVVNEGLIRRTKKWEKSGERGEKRENMTVGERVWKESRNEEGWTPEDLWVDGVKATREHWKPFWIND